MSEKGIRYSAGCLFEMLSGADSGCDYVPHTLKSELLLAVSGWRLGGEKA